MKKFKLLFAVCVCLIGLCITNNAFAQTPTQTVVVDFEGTYPLEGYSSRPNTNTYWAFGFPPNDACNNIDEGVDLWGDDIYIVTYSSKNTTFQISYGVYENEDENYIGSFWSGIGLSTKSSQTGSSWYDDGNGNYDGDDLLSVTDSGYNNSLTYGVVFGSALPQSSYCDENVPSIKLPENALLQSIKIANTQWTSEYLEAAANNIYLDLIIYGIGKNACGKDVVKASKTVRLSDLADWEQISFCAQWADVTELRFVFDSNDANEYGLLPPVYFAFDDLTFKLPIEQELP
jgi:hypothetical protein